MAYDEGLAQRIREEMSELPDEDALAKPHTKPFDMTGRPMKGWVVVNAEGYETDEDLQTWIQQGIDFALSLPAK